MLPQSQFPQREQHQVRDGAIGKLSRQLFEHGNRSSNLVLRDGEFGYLEEGLALTFGRDPFSEVTLVSSNGIIIPCKPFEHTRLEGSGFGLQSEDASISCQHQKVRGYLECFGGAALG